MQPGERESHVVQREAVVEVGDAGAFAFSVNGRPGKPLGDKGQVKTLKLTPATAVAIRHAVTRCMDPGFRSPLIDFFRRGEVARDVRLLAAQGALAPRAQEQIALLVLLSDDPDPEIRRADRRHAGCAAARAAARVPRARGHAAGDARVLRERGIEVAGRTRRRRAGRSISTSRCSTRCRSCPRTPGPGPTPSTRCCRRSRCSIA